MALEIQNFPDDFGPHFKNFHELMARKVREILLVSSLYDACILEEDCRLAERIINEYRGLNLSQPPRLTWVSSAEEALETLDKQKFDMVITMLHLADMDAFAFGREIKKRKPDLPVILLGHNALPPDFSLRMAQDAGIDRVFVWSGDSELLLAIVKSTEDAMNVTHDTETSGVRVILLIEDSPLYRSAILPILYRQVVTQTQALMEEGLNEEHRLLTMRARPKILVAENYEQALELFERYKPYLLGIISDVRFPHGGELDENAGVEFLTKAKREVPDLPILLTSSEPANREKADAIPALFSDKNSPSLLTEIKAFFINHLGFGDFVFRLPNGSEVARVSNVRALEQILPGIPNESFYYHWSRNDFSRWLFARTETLLASIMRPLSDADFSGQVDSMRDFLIGNLKARRKWRQKGVVADFDAREFDPETDFLKIGQGSLGGKARGLAFVATLLQRNPELHKKFASVNIIVPKTLVLTTEAFNSFIDANDLRSFAKVDLPDEEIADAFLVAELPVWVRDNLRAYLEQVNYPLAIRSSGLLEDAKFRAYAGLYSTYMIPNNSSSLDERLDDLVTAIKLVYASTYFRSPKAFGKRVGLRTEDEKMAVIVQQLIGERFGDSFYPAISGVAQSHNYYPFDRMKPEEGIATIALGLGRMVMEGEQTLRFSPKYPQLLPQFSVVEDMLKNSQQSFYALNMSQECRLVSFSEDCTLEKRQVVDALDEHPVRLLTSTYIPAEKRIRDDGFVPGHKIVTFAQVLKYKSFPLAEILQDVLRTAQDGMACPVELEFSVHMPQQADQIPEFAFLQLRPMSARAELIEVYISDEELKQSFCVSHSALGNTSRDDMLDIIYVKPDVFDKSRTVDIAREISLLNAKLFEADRPYLLIGPGRWGSADRWLGIPVKWADIHGVGAVVEAAMPEAKVEPSQGSHFFHNVTTLGINYFTVTENGEDILDWDWLTSLPLAEETRHVAHVALEKPFNLKVDGRKSLGAITAANGWLRSKGE